MRNIFEKLFLAGSAGLISGALVGLVESSYVLSSGNPEENVALFYAVVLYGLIGAGIGGGLGCGVIALDFVLKRTKKWTDGVNKAYAFTLPFLGVMCALGLVITNYYVNKVVYDEAGVPGGAKIKILAVYGLLGAGGLWLGPIFLTRTPLKVLLRLRGTIAVYVGLLLLSGIFAFAPDASNSTNRLNPEREQAGLAEQPNVLLVMVDTLRWDYLGSYDPSKKGISPHLDALAEDGVVFEKAFGAASWTRSATASLFTSMVPLSHKTEGKKNALPQSLVTIAELLQAQGYHTGGFPNNTNVTRNFGFDQGFDYFVYQSPALPFAATDSVMQLSMYQLVRKLREKVVTYKKVEEFYQPAPTVLNTLQEYIEAQKGQKWFAFTHLMEPHDPYFERPYNGVGFGRAENEVPDHNQMVGDEPLIDYLKRIYSQEITEMDKDFGAFIRWMKAEGIYDNTMIIVTSDHGEEFFEHGGWWHGTTLYEEQIRVPLIVKLPGQKWSGKRVPWQVRVIDVGPTIANEAGVSRTKQENGEFFTVLDEKGESLLTAENWQGENLFDADFKDVFEAKPTVEPEVVVDGASGQSSEDTPADAVVEASPALQASPVGDLSKYDRPVYAKEHFEGYKLEAVRFKGWKLIEAENPKGAKRVLPAVSLFEMSGFSPAELDQKAGMGFPVQGDLELVLKTEQLKALQVDVKAEEVELNEAEKAKLQAIGYMGED